MKKTILGLAIALVVMFLPGKVALADCYQNTCNPCNVCEPAYNPCCEVKCCPCKSWYVSGAGSVDWHRKMEIKTSDYKERFKFDTGGNASLAIGYLWNPFRFEVEGIFKYNSLKDVKYTRSVAPLGNASASPSGHKRDWAIMFNAFYDFPVSDDFSIYVGGGIGIAFTQFAMANYSRTVGGTDYHMGSISRDDTEFAWQLKGGLNYDVNCDFTVFLGYSFFATSKPGSFNRTISTPSGTLNAKWENFPYYHSVEAGLRYKFW